MVSCKEGALAPDRHPAMPRSFTRAIVRPPGPTFARGLTTGFCSGSKLQGEPDLALAQAQWSAACDALRTCGLELEVLPEDPAHPDATFVEDTAVLLPGLAVLTRPGAESRRGEVRTVRDAVERAGGATAEIVAPGTLDGGDVCEHGEHLFIGLSRRTNEEGARQLAAHAARVGWTASTLDIRPSPSLLHLKSGLASVEDGLLVATPELCAHAELSACGVLPVSAQEAYAANCVRVNDRVLLAQGFPLLAAALRERGLWPLTLAMSEFCKMDGGPSCLSLRF